VHKPLVLVATLTLALSAAGIARSTTSNMSFVFGRSGGNIAPFTVTIATDGSVTATGPAQPLKRQITPRDFARLATLVATDHFFSLPRTVQCPGALPDFAFSYATVKTRLNSRTVRVRGDCSPRFNKIYAALSSAVNR
jgi:hypothetical protein